MCNNTVDSEKGVCIFSTSVLPTNFETPSEGPCNLSGEPAPPYGHDQFKTPSSALSPNPTQQTQEKRKKRKATFVQSRGKKERALSKLIHLLSRIGDAIELINSASLESSLEIPGSSIRDVMKYVCTLDGVDEGSHLHRVAARIFQKREKREAFVAIKEPSLQLKFLKDEAKLLGAHYFST
jgi:hypothetical protein